MKIDSKITTPDHKPAILFRTNLWELEIIKGLVDNAVRHIPKTRQTQETVQRLKNIQKGFNNEIIKEWLKENLTNDKVQG